MFEFIFILVFFATLLVTGLSMFTIFAAAAFALLVMAVLGMIGAVIQLIPWLLVIALGIWFFRNYVYSHR
ncbi:envelope stress response protein PspG [Vibrio ostreicida]|uniref:Envelope stress response protein PspG n=1 Tax=Vibrio ostreicida TaxID=526588 RepID=A0ABT8BPR0_9VIBR|nr:envelope stress response protein PspG [Vibrio ostreicida]MDN3608928.1 envelope stress response protein PspG [Vibrio ostreicida]NPD09962.1 envelope stress response protein PspG [Vibrio ostreicida]